MPSPGPQVLRLGKGAESHLGSPWVPVWGGAADHEVSQHGPPGWPLRMGWKCQGGAVAGPSPGSGSFAEHPAATRLLQLGSTPALTPRVSADPWVGAQAREDPHHSRSRFQAPGPQGEVVGREVVGGGGR